MRDKVNSSHSMGALLAMIVFVACQLVNVQFGSIGSTPITLQKLMAATLLPAAVVLMWSCFRISVDLVAIGVAIGFAYSVSYVVDRQFPSSFWSANFTVLTGLFAATVIYSALTEHPDGMAWFARIWIIGSVACAAVTILQACSVPELIEAAVRGEALGHPLAFQRGTGFKTDPNFQALSLLMGLVFAVSYLNRYRLLVSGVIFLGILGTFSRMGLLVGIAVVIVGLALSARLDPDSGNKRYTRCVVMACVGVGLLIAVLAVQSKSFRDLMTSRYLTMESGFRSALSGDVDRFIGRPEATSSQERALLFRYGLGFALEHWKVGVGAHRAEPLMKRAVGLWRTSHITPLDFFLLGGVAGIVAWGFYWGFVCYCIVKARSLDSLPREANTLLLLAMAFFLSSLLISTVYNSILWLVPTVAAAVHRRSRELFPKTEEVNSTRA